eukprot:TRINITY_DN1171_c1_g1_i2.p3 TRINITY_DN1171_c1_g1~~TRINITY_DN1171_c1_g1_i2.p3  ORF type:complete len:110 (-),score=1.57 TRINITY_DN1171_c1_g1_i2:239-568(-)
MIEKVDEGIQSKRYEFYEPKLPKLYGLATVGHRLILFNWLKNFQDRQEEGTTIINIGFYDIFSVFSSPPDFVLGIWNSMFQLIKEKKLLKQILLVHKRNVRRIVSIITT